MFFFHFILKSKFLIPLEILKLINLLTWLLHWAFINGLIGESSLFLYFYIFNTATIKCLNIFEIIMLCLNLSFDIREWEIKISKSIFFWCRKPHTFVIVANTLGDRSCFGMVLPFSPSCTKVLHINIVSRPTTF